MKNFNFKTIIIYLLLFIYIIFSVFFGYQNLPNIMSKIINPLFYIILCIFTFILSDADQKQRIKAKTNKFQTIFIIIMSYLIIYMLLGLILGYVKNIYSRTVIGILKNIWMYIIPILCLEIIRNVLIRNSGNKKVVLILIMIIFTLIDIDLYSITQTSFTRSELFKLIFSNFIPILTMNIVLTYISKTSGYIANLIYRLPQNLTTIILPILPDLDWYFRGLLGIFLPIITFILIKNLNNKVESVEPRRRIKQVKFIRLLIILIPMIIFALFIAGIFKYKPTAIISNSMHPIFDRGDAVIVEKINTKNGKNLKKYDIIEYKLENIIVAHRIIHIEEHNDGSKLYITKGDNNTTADNKKVSPDQIIGVVKFRIPKVGYPTVWLNDFFNKQKVSIETEKS